MKNTLVHELIHAWQAEYEEDLGEDWHDETFHKWCNKLNSTGDFLFPLATEATLKELHAFEKTTKSAYYIYIKTKSNNIYGVFINFLYDNEIKWLQNKGFNLKYFTNIKLKDNLANIEDFSTHFSNITSITKLKITPSNIKSKIGKNKIFSKKNFNFESGTEI